MPDQVDETSNGAIDSVKGAVNMITDEDPSGWFDLSGWKAQALLALLALVVLVWVIRRIRRNLRRHRPVTLHPRLQRYGETAAHQKEELKAKRRAEAARIVATSSGATIAGYAIIEQIEAVFVDGFRKPEDAVEGLKAVAAMKGANALINVRHESTSSGHYTAAGDAVIAEKRPGASSENA
jgi:hypothetical protein